MALLPECLAVDVLRWRLVAAGIWHLVLVLSVSCTARAVLGSHVPPIALTLLSQALAFLGQIALFKSHPPTSSPILIPWVPLGLRIALSRALGPLSSLASLASSVTAAASLWLSALLSLSLTLDLKLAVLYSACLAAAYLHHARVCQMYVVTPLAVHRPRAARVRKAVPRAATALAGRAGASALAATALLAAPVLGAGALAAAPRHTAAALLLGAGSCAAIAALWAAGATLTALLLAEPLAARDFRGAAGTPDAAAPLRAAPPGSMLRALALRALAGQLAGGASAAAAALRAGLWADESGGAWAALAGPCLEELQRLDGGLDPLAAGAGASAAGATPGGRAGGWNPAPPSASGAGPAQERKAIVRALLAVFERGSDAADAARALGALCRSAVREDRSGVVQVARPGVGEVTHALLGTLGRVRALERRARALPPAALDLAAALGGGGRRGEDAALAPVWALQDALSTSLAGLADAYGAGLTSALAGALGARGGAGAAQEAVRLLAPFME
ncbi:hypothetical protein ACKKBF_B32940 [Auxenochlorella protothecoides x Auxenochlorella symbiontica]